MYNIIASIAQQFTDEETIATKYKIWNAKLNFILRYNPGAINNIC